MSELRHMASSEPGHRYQPRQIRPRFVSDINRPVRAAVNPVTPTNPASVPTHPANPVATNVTTVQNVHLQPLSAAVPVPVIKRLAVQPQPSQTRPDVALRPVSSRSAAAPSVPKAPAPHHRAEAGKTKPAIPRQHKSLVLHRRIVEKATLHKQRAKQQRTKSVFAFALGGAVALLVMGSALLLTGRLTGGHSATGSSDGSKTSQSPETLGVQTDKSSSSAPSEVKPTDEQIDGYDVAPTKPRVISIPALGFTARIDEVGLAYDGIPSGAPNVYDFGWLTDSATPGSSGVMVLTGYTAGPTKNGPLFRVGELNVGDLIQVEGGDGTITKYYVVSSAQYESNDIDMGRVRSPAISGKPGLNILTNLGRFNVRTNKFEPRTVIFAATE